MRYTYDTTKEMDEALAYNAGKNGQTAAELFAVIVTADMGTLVRNFESVAKERIYETYKKADETDKATINAIAAKVEEVVPVEEIIKSRV